MKLQLKGWLVKGKLNLHFGHMMKPFHILIWNMGHQVPQLLML